MGKKKFRGPPSVNAQVEQSWNEFPSSTCLQCGQPARQFDSSIVFELSDYLGRRISGDVLAARAREKLKATGCLIAPKCGVTICSVNNRVAP
jgi:hypothetical protein